MNYLRFIRLFAWACVGVVGLLVVAISMGWLVTDGPLAALARKEPSTIAKGGPFAMTDHRGKPFTEADLRGRPALVFFGFTSCPVVCPTTLGDMTDWLEELGPDGNALSAVFVSVDSERDDVAQMAAYLEPYNQRIVGLTGNSAQLEQFAANYGIYYKKVPVGDNNYTMDHTASVLMLDRALNMVGTVDFHEERSIAIAKLKLLLAR
ncbi:MAG: SCO family protein [Alphaproteobacteria bacterium]|jgi:protein SCO1/2|nr:SCO family protein [Alphaproteobacteria bacterium]